MYQPFVKKYLTKLPEKSLFMIAGEEEYFRVHSKRFLLEQFSEFPVVTLSNPDLNQIESELNSFDLFSDRKIIIIENYSPITTKSNKKMENDEINLLLEIVNKCEHIVLFFNEDNIDKRKKVTKELIAISHYIDCGPLNKREFSSFLDYLNNHYSINLSKQVLFDLNLHLNECSLLLLEKEFEKLKLFDGKIDENNIYQLISVSNQKNIFDLMDNLLSKKSAKTLEVYENLLFNKESEYVIYHFISNQFTHMLKIKMIKHDNLLLDIPKTLGIHPFMCDKLEKASRSFSMEQLIKIQNLLLETDLKIKHGVTRSVDAVKFLILSILVL